MGGDIALETDSIEKSSSSDEADATHVIALPEARRLRNQGCDKPEGNDLLDGIPVITASREFGGKYHIGLRLVFSDLREAGYE